MPPDDFRRYSSPWASSNDTYLDHTCSSTCPNCGYPVESNFFYITATSYDICYEETKERKEEFRLFLLELEKSNWGKQRYFLEKKERIKISTSLKILAKYKANIRRCHSRENIGVMNFRKI